MNDEAFDRALLWIVIGVVATLLTIAAALLVGVWILGDLIWRLMT